jgi:hypothetical protein
LRNNYHNDTKTTEDEIGMPELNSVLCALRVVVVKKKF